MMVVVVAASPMAGAQSGPPKPGQKPGQKPATRPANTAPVVPSAPTPPDYVIGPEDVLSIIVWREKDLSVEVAVRPDGKISVPLLNEVQAAGLTPEQLRLQLTEAAGKLIEEPNVTVVVKEVNSRKVFVIGQVGKPGPYPLAGPTTVLQLLSTAGGIAEYADAKNIRIMRTVNGKPVSFKFNFKDVAEGKKLEQNIELRPGDTIIVP
jgi:polysaccharide export outer membrane protein